MSGVSHSAAESLLLAWEEGSSSPCSAEGGGIGDPCVVFQVHASTSVEVCVRSCWDLQS